MPDDILADAAPERVTKGKTTQYVNPRSYDQAVNEFESLKPANVKPIEIK